jgi:hypothetical protein
MADILLNAIGLIITLAALSFLYKENMAYRMVEHIYVGFAAGHSLIMGLTAIRDGALIPMTTQGLWINIIPILLGLALFLRFSKQTRFASRWTMALILGISIGLGIAGTPLGIVRNIGATMVPLTTLDNIVIVVAVITAVTPFIFSERIIKIGGVPLEWIIKIGRMFVMIYLASAFATVTMSRITVSAGRILDILKYIGLA